MDFWLVFLSFVLEKIDNLIKDNVDYIVRTSEIFNNKPSKIIKIIGDNKFKVIR